MASIDIHDFTLEERAILLQMMWKNMKPAAFFTMNGIAPPEFTPSEDSMNAIKAGYIDYYQGRYIKTDLSGDTISPRLYERDSTPGSVQKFVDQIRSIRK